MIYQSTTLATNTETMIIPHGCRILTELRDDTIELLKAIHCFEILKP